MIDKTVSFVICDYMYICYYLCVMNRSPKPLPADFKSAVFELAQNLAQIFGMPEGTLYAHEISFVKSCTIRPLEIAKV